MARLEVRGLTLELLARHVPACFVVVPARPGVPSLGFSGQRRDPCVAHGWPISIDRRPQPLSPIQRAVLRNRDLTKGIGIAVPIADTMAYSISILLAYTL